jgi:hypothetical protein
MKRRNLLKSLVGLASLGLVSNQIKANTVKTQKSIRTGGFVVLQTSPVAGFQYYDGDKVWAQLQQGAVLQLKTEPSNKYDKDAVEIYWQAGDGQNYKLGYLPRKQNYAVSQILQTQRPLWAEVSQLNNSDDPWKRIEFDVYLQA